MPEHRCPTCEGPAAIRPVPTALRGILEDDPATVSICERCLAVHPAPGLSVTREWNPSEVSGALPNDPEATVGVAMLVTFLDSIALHRREIEGIVAYLEEGPGVDPLLALDRLRTAPRIEPSIDLERRREQLAQTLSR